MEEGLSLESRETRDERVSGCVLEQETKNKNFLLLAACSTLGLV